MKITDKIYNITAGLVVLGLLLPIAAISQTSQPAPATKSAITGNETRPGVQIVTVSAQPSTVTVYSGMQPSCQYDTQGLLAVGIEQQGSTVNLQQPAHCFDLVL